MDLLSSQHQEHCTQCHCHTHYRHCPACHHACRLVSLTPSREWHIDPSSLEPGMIRVHVCYGSRNPLMFSFRKNVIWLLLAIVAEVPPTVSPANVSLIFLFISYLMSQVFISLDLNGTSSRSGFCRTSTECHPLWVISCVRRRMF